MFINTNAKHIKKGLKEIIWFTISSKQNLGINLTKDIKNVYSGCRFQDESGADPDPSPAARTAATVPSQSTATMVKIVTMKMKAYPDQKLSISRLGREWRFSRARPPMQRILSRASSPQWNWRWGRRTCWLWAGTVASTWGRPSSSSSTSPQPMGLIA